GLPDLADHDPAAVGELQRYVAAALRATARWDGHLRQVDVGDKGSLLVLAFGAPVRHEDHEERAVRCCLELLALPGGPFRGGGGGWGGGGVLARAEAPGGAGAPPLVGRHAELAAVRAAVGRVAAGQGGVLGLAGEAGIGKSRLAAEAVALAGTVRVEARVGVCRSLGTASS